MRSSRFSRRRGNQNRKGTGVSAEVLDEVLKKEGLKGETDQADGVDDNLNISIRNREINEPINQEALNAEYKPSRTVTRSYRTSTEDREEKESSPYTLKAKSPHANNNEAPRAPPTVDVEPSSESEDEQLPPHRINRSGEDDDLQLVIEDLKEEIEELHIQLNKKDTIIAEKDFEIKKLKRAARRTQQQQQPRQSDF